MIPMTFATFSYYIMAVNLLGSLLFRLYLTFDGSMYRVSKTTRTMLNLLYILVWITMIPALIIYASCIPSTVSSETVQKRISVTIYFISSAFILYIITAAFCVTIFAQNMLKLSKSRASSLQNVMDKAVQDLNRNQTLFINKISRYVSLFTIAVILTFITMSSVFIPELIPSTFEGKTVQLILISGCIDGVMNIICLALQYSFSSDFYHKYCEWIECCWKRIFIRKTQREIQRKYESQMRRLQTRSVDTTVTNSNRPSIDLDVQKAKTPVKDFED